MSVATSPGHLGKLAEMSGEFIKSLVPTNGQRSGFEARTLAKAHVPPT